MHCINVIARRLHFSALDLMGLNRKIRVFFVSLIKFLIITIYIIKKHKIFELTLGLALLDRVCYLCDLTLRNGINSVATTINSF